MVVLGADEEADLGDDEGVGVTTLAPHATETIPTTSSSVWLLAVPETLLDDATASFVSLASPWPLDDSDPPTIAVPQSC